MKKAVISLFSVIFLLASCKEDQRKISTSENVQEEDSLHFDDEVIETAAIYEANIRQYSPEGTFEAFTKDKNLG